MKWCKILFCLIFIVLSLFSCHIKHVQNKLKDSNIRNIPENLPFLDTTVYLKAIKKSNYAGINLSDSIVNALFEKLKVDWDATCEPIIENDSMIGGKNCLSYDSSFYKINLNNNQYDDAIVLFWEVPFRASGTCYQPTKAFILDTDKGYSIFNEGFISENIAIDSVGFFEQHPTIFGHDYDCTTHSYTRKLRKKLLVSD